MIIILFQISTVLQYGKEQYRVAFAGSTMHSYRQFGGTKIIQRNQSNNATNNFALLISVRSKLESSQCTIRTQHTNWTQFLIMLIAISFLQPYSPGILSDAVQ